MPGLAPQYYSYTFKVDGTNVVDPHNVTLKTSFFGTRMFFLCPASRPCRGSRRTFRTEWCIITSTSRRLSASNSEYYVYTPPGFDPGSKQKYPVLYLLHGYSDDPSAWTAMGKANVILDNLIAQGKAKPMIVVMPLGYGTMEVITRGWSTWNDPELVRRNYTRFSDALFQEVMPLVKQQYPLSDKREEHAVAGFIHGRRGKSAGRSQSPRRLRLCRQASALLLWEKANTATSRLRFRESRRSPRARLMPGCELLWIACGTEDGLFEPNQKFIAWLKEKGVQPTVIQTPGMHVWMVWRDNLTNFPPLLFQAK